MVATLVQELVQSAIGEKRVTLHCAGWDGYRAIAIALGEGQSARLTFGRTITDELFPDLTLDVEQILVKVGI